MRTPHRSLRGQEVRRAHLVQLRAAVVSRFRRAPLPPGNCDLALDVMEKADRQALLRLARDSGPVFRGRAWGEFWIYVVGLQRCRNILRQHEDDLRPVTIDVSGLFEIGLLRQMEGADHRHYRSALTQAIKGAAERQVTSRTFASIFDRNALATGNGIQHVSAEDYRAFLSRIAFDALVQIVFGIPPGSAVHARLSAAFADMGGNGLVWNIGTRQSRAYAEIAAILRAEMSRPGGAPGAEAGLLGILAAQGAVDAVMLGNLIYMVEMGRYDMAAFFRWLTWFAATQPIWMERIAAETDVRSAVTAAFVMEALRLEQSERLVRHVKRDFVAEGFLFPKGAKVRFCVWESHKYPDAHADPFTFDPGRFIGNRPGPERFSPFGMDRHQCPFGSHAIDLGSAFLTALATRYTLGASGSGEPVRGLYHWEPAEDFVPVLRERPARSTKRAE